MASWSRIARRIRVPLGFALAGLYLWQARPTRENLLAGSVLIVAGLIVRALASGYVQKDEALATGGPYAYTRNPLYLGSLILAIGFGLAARSWWIVLAMAAMFFAIYLPVIGSEEAFLRGRFPEFAEYAAHVPRLFPRIRPFKGKRGEFSPDLYWKHREYQAVIGSAALVVALVVKMIWIH